MYSEMADMVLREVVEVDPDLCDGCALCMLDCSLGALVVENGKARLISDKLCAGSGCCLHSCPHKALRLVRREAGRFDIKDYLEYDEGPDSIPDEPAHERLALATPKMAERQIGPAAQRARERNWPIKLSQIRAIPAGADILLCADCAAARATDFQQRYASGRFLVTICPKLEETGVLAAKLAGFFVQSRPRSLMAMRMDEDCCRPMCMVGTGALNMSGVSIKARDVVIGPTGGEIGEGRVGSYEF